MKILLAATLVGAAIAGLILYAQRPVRSGNALPGGPDAEPLPDTARGTHAMG
ncbi:hypothetical protein [Flaviaesturariibacter amylovorans]|uniref:hypothetical protein n=1 Tax=Flaviaesturariibacter amylovorans TaxID=1084520 RepID=UPI0031EFFF96